MSQRRHTASAGGASSNAETKVLPLIACPRCGGSVIRLVSRQPASFGWVFYKCEHNNQDDPTTCAFWKWQNDYERILRRLNLLPIEPRGTGDNRQGATEAGIEVNQDQIEARMWRAMEELKLQLAELIRKLEASRKKGLSEIQWVVAVVLAATFGFFLGLVVAKLLK